jgi:hypothetical protein
MLDKLDLVDAEGALVVSLSRESDPRILLLVPAIGFAGNRVVCKSAGDASSLLRELTARGVRGQTIGRGDVVHILAGDAVSF